MKKVFQYDNNWQDMRDASVMKRLAAHQNRVKPIAPSHPAYLAAIDKAKAIVCVGPAGTGKTFMAAGKAVEMFREGKVSRIVITRPLQECGEEIGFLPGDMWEKIQDMMAPLLDALDEFLGPGELEKMRENGELVVVPLAKMRGRTLKDAFVILDEAQNATYAQLRMFLTRFGSKCKMVVCGDHTQSDLPYEGENALLEMVDRFDSDPHKDVRVIRMTEADIVRDELVKWFDSVMTRQMWSLPAYHYNERPNWQRFECSKCNKPSWHDARDQAVECFNCGNFVPIKELSVSHPFKPQ